MGCALRKRLDNAGRVISYAGMRRMNDIRVAVRLRLVAVGLAAGLCLLTSGCLGPEAKHTAALSAAYAAANDIHQKRMDFDAVAEFDLTTPVYSPRVLHPLISDADVELRLAVLKAFQCYVQELVAVTNGLETPALDAASASLGQNLASVGNTLAPPPASSSTTSDPALTISAETQNLLSTGANALGQFLEARVVKKDLPAKLATMDPQVEKLCKLLASEIDYMHDAETKDFDHIISRETLFLRDPASKLSAEERRLEIMKLPELAREQHATELQLTALKAAILKLELTHHAFLAAEQGNNPGSLKSTLADLEAAGNGLNKFYRSLSSN
jgi:hypothetical protein